MIGRTIDERYRVDEVIGQGGMGAVYVAEHLGLHKQVALKVIHPQFAGDGEVAARFAREAMACARIEHPNVASALDFGTLPEGGAYLVLQLVEGQALQDLIEAEGPLEWREVCRIGAQIADALAAAHAQDIVHRDLKPDNVLLEQQGGSPWARVLDFGIAQVGKRVGPEASAEFDPDLPKLTAIGTVVGTLGYMAPEQAMGQAVDARVDIYALGVVLWEMMTGRRLFVSKDLTQIVTRQLTDLLPLPSVSGGTGVPPVLDALLVHMLAPKKDDRPSDAGQIRDALRDIADGDSPSWIPAIDGTLTDRADNGAGKRDEPARTSGRHWEPAPSMLSGHPMAWVALACAAIALAIPAVLAISLLRSSPGGAANAPATAPETADAGPPRTAVGESAQPAESEMSAAVQGRVTTLLSGERARDRNVAAQWLARRRSGSEVPAWVRDIARLETARSCRQKHAALRAFGNRAVSDARPALERLAATPRRGCGARRRADCLACLRATLAATLAQLPEASE